MAHPSSEALPLESSGPEYDRPSERRLDSVGAIHVLEAMVEQRRRSSIPPPPGSLTLCSDEDDEDDDDAVALSQARPIAR